MKIEELKKYNGIYIMLLFCSYCLFIFINHISSSIVVYKSIKGKKIYLFIVLIIYNEIISLPIIFSNVEIIKIPVLVVYLIYYALIIGISIFAYLIYKDMEDEGFGEIQPISENRYIRTPIMKAEGLE